MAQMPPFSDSVLSVCICFSCAVLHRVVSHSESFSCFSSHPGPKGVRCGGTPKKIFRAESFKCVTVVCRGVVCVAVGLPHTGLRLSEEGAG